MKRKNARRRKAKGGQVDLGSSQKSDHYHHHYQIHHRNHHHCWWWWLGNGGWRGGGRASFEPCSSSSSSSSTSWYSSSLFEWWWWFEWRSGCERRRKKGEKPCFFPFPPPLPYNIGFFFLSSLSPFPLSFPLLFPHPTVSKNGGIFGSPVRRKFWNFEFEPVKFVARIKFGPRLKAWTLYLMKIWNFN